MANMQKDNLARLSREQESRAAQPVHEPYADWDNDSLLDTKHIPAREGYVQRWVRTSVKGENDQSNVFKKINRGWRPRPADSIPKGQFVMNVDFQGVNVVGIHGMILMERPIELHDRQKRQVDEQNKLQMSAVKQNLYKVHDPSSGLTRPEFNEESRVTKGRIAPIIDD